jgi:hypothetical protein
MMFEPVAEPAEPSTSPDLGPVISQDEASAKGNAAYSTTLKVLEKIRSAEPTAAGHDCAKSGFNPLISTCRQCPAPQPVIACPGIAACTQKEACLKVNRCLINLPQPVAGEGPDGNLRRLALEACDGFNAQPNHGSPEAKRIMDALRVAATAPEGTPKLEEVAARQLNALTEFAGWYPTGERRIKTLAILADILRPFITPACAPPADLLEAWHHLRGQIEAVLAGNPVKCFDETMSAMNIAVRRAATPASTGEAGKWEEPSELKMEAAKAHVREFFPDSDPDAIEALARSHIQYVASVKDEVAEQIEKVSTGEANGWISVEERLPINHDLVLVHRETGTVDVGWHHITAKRWYSGHTRPDGNFTEQFVTHWQPLPPAPTSVPQAEPPK